MKLEYGMHVDKEIKEKINRAKIVFAELDISPKEAMIYFLHAKMKYSLREIGKEFGIKRMTINRIYQVARSKIES